MTRSAGMARHEGSGRTGPTVGQRRRKSGPETMLEREPRNDGRRAKLEDIIGKTN
jgi:hypothetical protein